LQVASFWKVPDMIKGNADVPLPSDASMDVPDASVGIPNGPTLQETRSA
jgi:hypothetical protein